MDRCTHPPTYRYSTERKREFLCLRKHEFHEFHEPKVAQVNLRAGCFFFANRIRITRITVRGLLLLARPSVREIRVL